MNEKTTGFAEIAAIELASVSGGDFEGWGIKWADPELRRSMCGAPMLAEFKKEYPNATPAEATQFVTTLCNGGTTTVGKINLDSK